MSITHPLRQAGRALATTLLLAASLPAAANELVNPGFEADAAPGSPLVYGASGWFNFQSSWTASGPTEPVRSGVGSMRLDSAGGFNVPGSFQTFAAQAGQTWDVGGWLLTPEALPQGNTWGMLKLVWSDGTNFLAPDVVNVGTANFVDFGIESGRLDASSTPGNWQFAQAQGVAPVGTTQVYVFMLLVDESAATVYFDDLVVTSVPEPASAAMLLLGLAGVAGAAGVKRRRRA